VKNVHLIGRRGPLQAAFTIKELREILKLPNCRSIWRDSDFAGVADQVLDLPRPRKRITELMLKSLSDSKTSQSIGNVKTFQPIFYRSPKAINSKDGEHADSIELTVTKLVDNKAIATTDTETLDTGLVCRSIGYKSIMVDDHINFDEKSGCVHNIAGTFGIKIKRNFF
jgi:adrenodoxin-NADP+ reductase